MGPVRAQEFASLGIATAGDLLEYVPFRYELAPKSCPIGHLEEGKPATIVAGLRALRVKGSYSRQMVDAELEDGTGRCRARWFNAPYMREKLEGADVLRVSGTFTVDGPLALFTNPTAEVIEAGDDPFRGDEDRFTPVYSATRKLPSKEIGRIVRHVLGDVLEQVRDPLPEALRQARSLPPRKTALHRIHAPTNETDVEIARTRLAYDELLACQIAVQTARRARAAEKGAARLPRTPEIDRRIRARLPFELTPSQSCCVEEICADLDSGRAMNRLLHGDVGSGKTAVALYAALVAVAAKRQVALLAPTEVLARQHAGKFSAYLKGGRVRLEILTGATKPADRKRVLEAAAGGTVDILVGTHALIEQRVSLKNLGMVIVDEQHKFGVRQRGQLLAKGRRPHLLVLSATPIPRTLAMTAFGDLDVSKIEGRPPGRSRVGTRIEDSRIADRVWAEVVDRAKRGERAYVVYPLVEENPETHLRSAQTEFERLAQGPLRELTLALLHGRMKAAEKFSAMERFRRGDAQVLVSTTVIEVGVDVPEATLMIVENAERFGLSQLHQLRGRVGRGSRASECILMTESNADAARERLDILCQTDDGFRIAEEDLRIRGPGELLGTRQHGMPTFRIADLARDAELLFAARDDAAKILKSDPALRNPEHRLLGETVRARFGQSVGWLNVA